MSAPDYVIRIDPTTMTIELYGVRYALEVFGMLGLGKPGDALEIVRREGDILTLQKLHRVTEPQSEKP